VTPLVASAVLVLLLSTGLYWWSNHQTPVDQSLTLANSGFENGTIGTAMASSRPSWYGDFAEIVEERSDVEPVEGHRMVRFLKSAAEPDGSCEIYQIVDVSQLKALQLDELPSVEASAFFNGTASGGADHGFLFGITVFALGELDREDPDLWPLRWDRNATFGGSQSLSDSDTESWQQVSTRLSLPAHTRFLVVQLAVSPADTTNANADVSGQFADNVTLKLVNAR
jgi:hypothetical protein